MLNIYVRSLVFYKDVVVELFVIKLCEECSFIGFNFSVLRLLGDENNRESKYSIVVFLLYWISSIFGDEKILLGL